MAGRWHIPVGVLVALLWTACTPIAEEGSSSLVSTGLSPGSLMAPAEEVGGLVEVARVTFAGRALETDLIGDPRPVRADGLTYVVGMGAFTYPRSVQPTRGMVALPAGPAFLGQETMRCILESGPAQSPAALSGIPVDAGIQMRLDGVSTALHLILERVPQGLGETEGSPMHYYSLDQARKPGEFGDSGNWSGGATVTFSNSGADLPRARERGSIPFGIPAPEGLTLPRALINLTVRGVPLTIPPRDPGTGTLLEEVPDLALPGPGETLTFGWQAISPAPQVTLVLEYLGQGSGRCPASCLQGENCCELDSDCRSSELCKRRAEDGIKACFPSDGSGTERLGALVCSIRDANEAILTGELVESLTTAVTGAVYGAVVRLGWSSSSDLTLPDVLTATGTRQPLSPVRFRAADVYLMRFQPPAGR